jgi:ABC-type dipeptide/oligopeptide/nickel transport system permease component
MFEHIVNQVFNFIKADFVLSDDKHIIDQIDEIVETIFSSIPNLVLVLLSIFMFGRVVTHYQTKRTKFYFQPTNEIIQDILKSTKLTQIVRIVK